MVEIYEDNSPVYLDTILQYTLHKNLHIDRIYYFVQYFNALKIYSQETAYVYSLTSVDSTFTNETRSFT